MATPVATAIDGIGSTCTLLFLHRCHPMLQSAGGHAVTAAPLTVWPYCMQRQVTVTMMLAIPWFTGECTVYCASIAAAKISADSMLM